MDTRTDPEDLLEELTQADPADAPPVAEALARRLGEDLEEAEEEAS